MALTSLVLLLLHTTMIGTAVTVTIPLMTQGTPQQDIDCDNLVREGSAVNPNPTSPYHWAKTYGGGDFDVGRSVQNTSDGGYIVAGCTGSFGLGSGDVWVLKLNSTGDVKWQKSYGGSGEDDVYSVQQTVDGGYIVAGYTESFGAGGVDAWLLKLDSAGGVTWQKTYGGSGNDRAYSVQQTSDGGYIVAGYMNSSGASGYDVWVLKLNSTGGVTWQKTYGDSSFDGAWSVQQTSDGGYIVAGSTYSFGSQSGDAWVLKLNSTGGMDWQKTYGGSIYPDGAHCIRQTSDGGYIITGHFGFGGDLVWVLKLSSTGGVDWQWTYWGGSSGHDDEGWSVQQTADGDYIVAGHTETFGQGGYEDVWVLKLNSTGRVTWQKTYGGGNWDEAYSIEQTADKGYIVTGYANSFYGYSHNGLWVLKLNSTGLVPWNKGSGASTRNSSAVPWNPYTLSVYDTYVTPVGSTAAVQDTHVTPRDSHAIVGVQSGYQPDTTSPARISNLATSNPTNTSITLNWTAPGDDGMTGNATGYIIKYSTSGVITATNWNSSSTYNQTWTPAKNGTTETHVVTGLANGTKYWFAVEAYDVVQNYGGVSNSPNAKTTTTTPRGGTGEDYTLIIITGVVVLVVVLVGVVLVAKKRSPT